MDTWHKSFSDKIGKVQSRWIDEFERVLDASVAPEFEGLTPFLRENGFTTSIPLQKSGRRSFKFELAEDAYLLLIFQSSGLGELELSREAVVPGEPPSSDKSRERLSDVNRSWVREELRRALDGFVDRLNGTAAAAASAQVVPA